MARCLPLVLLLGLLAHGAASAGNLADAARERDRTTALGLLAQRADVAARDSTGATALHWAVHHDDVDLVERLLRAKADVHAVSDYGATPLSEAAIVGNPRVITLLLKAGADPDARSAKGQTALMVIARTANLAAAKALLGRGADVNAAEAVRGQTALMWAAAQAQPAMVRELLAQGADPNARTFVNEDLRQVSGEPRAQYRSSGGLTPLLFAAREGCLDCAKALVAKGARIDDADPEGVTPLIVAVNNFHFDTASFLLEQGADPALALKYARVILPQPGVSIGAGNAGNIKYKGQTYAPDAFAIRTYKKS